MNSGTKDYPYEIKKLDPEEHAEVFKQFNAETTWTQELVWQVANDFNYAKAEDIPLVNRFSFIESALFSTKRKPKKSLDVMRKTRLFWTQRTTFSIECRQCTRHGSSSRTCRCRCCRPRCRTPAAWCMWRATPGTWPSPSTTTTTSFDSWAIPATLSNSGIYAL
ncbi:unnamed protein product [Chilo suppressalis]|uniref:Uncharacterized protein n=1 Tax=Chilo suppressalis TaxID=168631 RepID=A0ABN8LAF3_CHISP|nr:unnamed protein product [Chilo suppressalis]